MPGLVLGSTVIPVREPPFPVRVWKVPPTAEDLRPLVRRAIRARKAQERLNGELKRIFHPLEEERNIRVDV